VEGDSTILTIIPAGTYHNIVWTPDSNISSISVANPTVSPQVSTTYAVAAADSNNCHVAASINVPVTPNGEPDFVMPTAFSPNGDNMNDTFRPVLRAGSELISFHIYNRWGELVYDKDRDNSDGWNGFYKNASQPIGVYVYYITVKGVAGNIIKHEGNLTLLR
jgi:gliding motility-associated-like protein